MEQMQTDLATTLNDKIKAENCNKRIKKEEEELRQTIQNQTDQVEIDFMLFYFNQKIKSLLCTRSITHNEWRGRSEFLSAWATQLLS